MKDEWDNPDFVIEWDQITSRSSPIRNEQLDMLISILEATYREGAAILDLGIGSGQVESLLFGGVQTNWRTCALAGVWKRPSWERRAHRATVRRPGRVGARIGFR